MSKPNWLGSFSVRMSDWFKKNDGQNLLKDGIMEVGKQLLIDAAKSQIGL